MVAEKISEDWTRFGKKQILSIGKKRGWVHDEDDEFDDAQAQGEGGNSSSDDEEGRTSAVKEKRKKARVPSAHSNDAETNDEGGLESEPPKKKKKKKKKGSKERERESFMNASDGSATKVPADIQNAKEGVRDEGVSNNKGNAGDRTDTDKRDSNRKRKRKKVRSRQKNIRKDTRSVDAKPSHLVLGRSDYAGRPLTEETRKRLGLETMNDSVASQFDETFDSGEWVGGDKGARTSDGPKEDMDKNSAQRTTGKTDDDGANNLTKIGDCFVDAKPNESKEPDLGKSMSMFSGKREKNKKKKQRKFKNLATV